MNCRVLLLLAAASIQVLLVNGTLPPDGGAKGALSDEANAKIAKELLKLRENTERFKQEMLRHAASFPELKSKTDSLVNSFSSQTDGFTKFGKERPNAQKNPHYSLKGPKDSQLRRNNDALKNLEKQVLGSAQTTVGQNQPRKSGAVSPLPVERKDVSRSATTPMREPSLTKQHREVSNSTHPQRSDATADPHRGTTSQRREPSAPNLTVERKEVPGNEERRDLPATNPSEKRKETSRDVVPHRKRPTDTFPTVENTEGSIRTNPPKRDPPGTLPSEKRKEVPGNATPHRKAPSATSLTVERKEVTSNVDSPRRDPHTANLSEKRKETSRAGTPHRKGPSSTSLTAENTEGSIKATPPRRNPPVTPSSETRKEVSSNETPQRRNLSDASLTEELKELSSNTNPQKRDPPVTPSAEELKEGLWGATPHRRELFAHYLIGKLRRVFRRPRTPRRDSDTLLREGRKDVPRSFTLQRTGPSTASLTSDSSEESGNDSPLKREPSVTPLREGRKEASISATLPRMPPTAIK